MLNRELEQILNRELSNALFVDYSPNGLQVEGRKEIKKIVTGVTACQRLIDAAIKHQADAIIVHHGYFWRNESPVITSIKRNRLKMLLSHDINLFAYHLPLDAHPYLGNNAQLAKLLQIQPILPESRTELLWQGAFDSAITGMELRERLEMKLDHDVLHCGETGSTRIQRVAWCSGSGQSYIEQAITLGVDAFISGEISEQTIHIAREGNIHFFAAGHHATERYGIKALGEWLAKEHMDIDVMFIDIDNPA